MAKYEVYAEYKDSGVEWLGEIPSHWDSKPLKYLCTYNDEVLTEATSSDTEIQYIDIGSVSATEGISHIETMLFKDAPSRARRIVKDGDVIVSTVRTYLEAIAPVDNPPENLIVSTGFAVIRPNKNLYKGYAAYCLRAKGFIKEVVARSVGVSYPAINSSDLVNIAVPSITYSEQTKIANFLDYETSKIDSLIEKQQELIQLLKEKRQAVISHAVTKGLNPNVPMKDSGLEWLGQVPEHWVRYAIKNLCYVNDGNHGEEYPTEADFVENGEGVPFIRAGDFEDFRVVSKNLRYISHEKNNSMRKGRLQENDILFVNRGATIGKLCIIDKAYAGSNLNSQIAYLRADKTLVDYRYLTYFLSSLYTQTNIVSSIYGGALPQYPIQNIINLDVWSGGLEEQSMIADYLDEQVQIIIYLIGKCELAIKLLQERRTALISAAVTGKIDVRNWQNPTEAKMEFSA